MREIKLPISGVVKPTPGSPVNLGTAIANAAAVQHNRQRVLVGAIAIEHQLESIIVDRTFEGETGAKLSFFINNILAAEWFTFSAKRRLAVHVVNE